MRGGATRPLLALGLVSTSLAPVHADPVRGERVFQRCYACHSVVAGEDKLPGPNLRCVLGRRAGTLTGFEFTAAMTEAGAGGGLAWTQATLDAFLADPQRVVPGTAMAMPGLPGADDRRDVIDYLETAGGCTGGASGGSFHRPPARIDRGRLFAAAWVALPAASASLSARLLVVTVTESFRVHLLGGIRWALGHEGIWPAGQ